MGSPLSVSTWKTTSVWFAVEVSQILTGLLRGVTVTAGRLVTLTVAVSEPWLGQSVPDVAVNSRVKVVGAQVVALRGQR
jgi:hypothetical protein